MPTGQRQTAAQATFSRPNSKSFRKPSLRTQVTHVLQRIEAAPASLTPADVLTLQRSIGNRATGQLLQAKLKLGPAGDRYEQEADRVAKQVVQASHKPAPQHEEGGEETIQASRYADSIAEYQRSVTPVASGISRVQRTFVAQRQMPGVQRDEIEDELQASPNHGLEGGEVDTAVAQSIQRAKGRGQPLDEGVRGQMEQGFGASFGGVRVHTDAQADTLNRSLNAKAFTAGNDIFFGKGAYQPGSSSGQELIAHELTHTVQQGATGKRLDRFVVQRSKSKKYKDLVSGISSSEAKEVGETYLAELDNKEGSKEEIHKRKREGKDLAQILKLPKNLKNKDQDFAPTLKSTLLLFRAKGFRDLERLKEFLLANVTRSTSLMALMRGKGGRDINTIKSLVSVARERGFNEPEVINVLVSTCPSFHQEMEVALGNIKNGIDLIGMQLNQLEDFPADFVEMMQQGKEMILGTLLNIQDMNYYDARPLFEESLVFFQSFWETVQTYLAITAHGEYADVFEVVPEEVYSEGQAKKVAKVGYGDPENPEWKVFSQDEMTYDSATAPGALQADIPELGSNFSYRSVAAFQVDDLLQVGLTPNTVLGVHEGKFGTIQDVAPGKAPQKKDENSETGTFRRDFDYTDPEIQRQLCSLQLLDGIVGQVDRHAGNYFIQQDETGTIVSAIDNDMAFGIGSTDPTGRSKRDSIPEEWNKDKYMGLPPFVDRELAERVINFSPNQLQETLSTLLYPDEIAATVSRFTQVRGYLESLQTRTSDIRSEIERLETARNSLLQKNTPKAHRQASYITSMILDLYAGGALLERNEWGDETNQILTGDNSYFGRDRDSIEKEREMGTLLPRN